MYWIGLPWNRREMKSSKQFGRIDVLINGAGGNHPDAITDQEAYERT